MSSECPFCRRDRAAGPPRAYVPCPHPSFRSIAAPQPGGDYAYHALGIDINVGFPAAGDAMDIDRAVLAILARHYVLVDDVWFAESDEAVRSAHREIRKYLASLEAAVIV